MKFAYVDESGDKPQGDVFVMAGVLVDAYKLRKHTATFDKMITDFLAKHPRAPKEMKTKALINGDRGWGGVDAAERKRFISNVCALAVECVRIFAVALSFDAFEKAAKEHNFSGTYWMGAAMFVAGLVQKKMQLIKKNKGLTVLIFDDNRREVPNLSDALYEADPWYDPIYQTRKKGEAGWKEISQAARFNQIINAAFAIKSHHSSYIQVADAVCYIYRRHVELKSEKEAWVGEKEYFAGLVNKLEPLRERLGQNPGGPCIEFYEAARHKEWGL
jgi:hypothetical protein